jgi:cytochrome c553
MMIRRNDRQHADRSHHDCQPVFMQLRMIGFSGRLCVGLGGTRGGHRLVCGLLVVAATLVQAIPAAVADQPAASTPQTTDQETDQAINFNRDIRPLLSDRCFACHGPDAEHRQADLRLDIESEAKQYAIEPGSAANSLLVERITSDDPDMVMPPPEMAKPLTDEQIDRLRRWVDAGAPYETHWAYVPPRWHEPAKRGNAANDQTNWIDRLIADRWKDRGVAPADRADPVTLIRRLSFDLTGLPPTPEMIDRYAGDPSESNYRQIVDQMLQSELFGQRMAVVWLDLVRYADTVGYHGDQDHQIAPYRDWVIDALNANMPFDQFTRHQLAGDLIPEPTIDSQIASGYNRLLQTSHEGGVQVKEYLAIYSADRVRNVSAVWMGATLGCAQCHDHKYDPYTAKDFYAMAAFFADIDEERHFHEGSNALPTKRPPEIDVLRPADRQALRECEAELDQLRKQLDSLDASAEPQHRSDLEARITALKQQCDRIGATARRTMITVAKQPRQIRILPRGNWLDDSGPVVEPAVPEFLGRSLDLGRRPTRLDLANWLMDVEGGYGAMAARVMANRVWGVLFGQGLSESLDDFGGQGQPPHHPELLDNLAIEFYTSGWDLKHLMRTIVTSDAYRRESVATPDARKIDPANHLLTRQNRFRLPAEMIRDTALSIGGLLVLEDGGQSARPYQPEGYYRHLNFPERTYRADTDQNQYRRGVYVHWQRQFVHPMLRAFDAPTREECTARRARSNTPLAALVMMNDPTIVEAARGLAMRLLAAPADSDRQRIETGFRLAVSRAPEPREIELLQSSLDKAREEFAADPDAADALISIGLTPHGLSDDAGAAAELAAWTELGRTLLNLSETITRP